VTARRRSARAARPPGATRELLSALDAVEVGEGLWRWVARHPTWHQAVGSVAAVGGPALVLVDPMLPDDPAVWKALARAAAGAPPAVLLTIRFHRRSTLDLVRRHRRARVWFEAGAARRSRTIRATDPFLPGDVLPGGFVALPTSRAGEVILWHPGARAIVPGDVLLGDESGGVRLCPASWLPRGHTLQALARSLGALPYLPVERVLVSHGEPVLAGGQAALAACLAEHR
jgi:hypothetical protein